MEKIKAFLLSDTATRFYWNTLYGFIGLVIVYLSGESYIWVPVVIAFLNGLSKEVRKKCFD
jgi:hypothetical protein